MELLLTTFLRLFLVVAIACPAVIIPVYGQGSSSTPSSSCSASMLSSFTPCMNFVTNSTTNGTVSPSSDCCSSLKSLTNGGMNCLCLILTGNVPLQLPINRTLAISLPRACNMPGVPLQCQATVAPIPAPGPAAFGPTSAAPTPKASIVPGPTAPALAPVADTTPPSVESDAPTTTAGIRPVVNPSTAFPSNSFSPSFLAIALAIVAFKLY